MMVGVLRVALVGIGDAAKHHARALAAAEARGSLQWSAVVGRDPAKLAAFMTDLSPNTVRVTETRALFDRDLCDAVVLATPDGVHEHGVVETVGHGRAVLVEKPLAQDVDSATRAVEAAARAGVHLAVGYHHRFHAGHRRVTDELAARTGRLRTIAIRWAWPDPAADGWRARAEQARWWSLAALGTHAIDLVLAWAGVDVTEVAAMLVRTPSGVDHAASVSLRTSDDVLAHVSVAVTHRSRGSITLTGDAGELELRGTLGARGTGEIVHRVHGQSDATVAFEPVDPYLAQIEAFADAAARGFVDDPSLLANVRILERCASASG